MAHADTLQGTGRPLIEVEVVQCAGREHMEHHRLQLPEGSLVRDALAVCGLQAGASAVMPLSTSKADPDDATPGVGVWGRLVSLDRPLAPGDRVEVYRPLQVDPMDARRLRHRRQRASNAQAKTKGSTSR
jgi:putative ubiquitin-RnfH superfamily antitoxin RatB of RatAB toxin-antitoxin module